MVPGIVVALLVVLAPEEVAAAVGGGRCTTPAAIDGCDVALEPTVPAAPMVGVLEVGIVAISYHDIRHGVAVVLLAQIAIERSSSSSISVTEREERERTHHSRTLQRKV